MVILRKDGKINNGCHVDIEDFVMPINPVKPNIDLHEIVSTINHIVDDLALIKQKFGITYPDRS